MKKKAIKYIRHSVITRASRLELEIWSLKLPILPIKLYSFYYSHFTLLIVVTYKSISNIEQYLRQNGCSQLNYTNHMLIRLIIWRWLIKIVL